MLSKKAIIRLSTLVGILTWISMTISDLIVVFSSTSEISSGISQTVPRVLHVLFIIAVFIFYRYRIGKAESVNFVDLLWKVFVTGLVTTVISLFFRFFMALIGNTRLAESVVLIDLIYLINLGLFIAFLVSTFVVWKRLILYQKSKILLTGWKVFEYALLVGLLLRVLSVESLLFLSDYYRIFLVLLGVVLSANMKWVAYLNFKQKWKSILLIALALFYLGYFIFTLYTATIDLGAKTTVYLDFSQNLFITGMAVFIFIYSLFSLLVILFNLPTSSVFEQKLEEVVNFQRLSQSIQTEQSEERVYEILLDSSVSTVFADAAWIEISESDSYNYYTHNISEKEVEIIKKYLHDHNVSGILDENSDKVKNVSQHLSMIKGLRYRSIIAFPIHVKGAQIGNIVLLKDVADGFNKEMDKIIATFANQAGISIENFRLLSEALENERYKEELKIAQRVQSSLLPDHLAQDGDFEIVAFSEAADEVGGDYYDTMPIDDERYALIISDVSGKGTSAAFHMSQMKGVFHSLAQLGLTPEEFMIKSNKALSMCLDKTSFITVSFFIIDTEKKSVLFSRAGHCPTLYYNAKTGDTSFFENKGMGIGILRNDRFKDYVHEDEIKYNSGDVLVMYTDGITEAKSMKNDEYGYERLRELVKKNVQKDAADIQKSLIDDLYSFTGTSVIDDDYTIMIVKFK